MDGILKQSTAVTVKVGPFKDSTDGDTDETALTITAADVRLSKNGGNMAAKGEATALAHDEVGVYNCLLNTTDTGTLGILRIDIHEAGALSTWGTFLVVTANFYDFLFSTDRLDVNVTHVADTAQTGNDNGADINTMLARLVGTIATGTHNPQGGDSYARIGATGSGLTSLSSAAALAITDALVDTLIARLTATRATNLDELGAANLPTDIDALLTRLSTARAGYLDELAAGNIPTDLANIPTVADFNARTLVAASYFDPAADTVALVTDITTKTGFALSDAGVDAVFDRNSSLSITFEELLERTYQMINNKMTVNEATGAVALRNIGDSATLVAGNVASSSGTTTRAELITW